MTLIIKNLYKKYKNKYIVKNISLDLNPGEIVGLIGPNGSGKTTFFYTVVGIIKPNQGKIFLKKKDITKIPMYQRSKEGIGYLSQEPSIFRKLSVEDNILCILEMQKKFLYKKRKEITEKLLEELRLKNIRNRRGDLLSGGERKRTEIARCLATNPKFILLDEPFSGIDPIALEELQEIILALKKKNVGILITDHNVKKVFTITDKIYMMFEGRILKQGSSMEIMQDILVREVYLGNHF
ncbi:LPS export ABC transporter ATP-binding protein [Blattabacterium cuenoti]|uniref:LPS export ABC transporter ATP-binding protein n=1 Tax=Blattabacterium cuenoti TaxID=1653831 RepID=UPI00163C398C|nr:LPS export ABC transporter ATP-binding protein [Blattabacterium cuenoti]